MTDLHDIVTNILITKENIKKLVDCVEEGLLEELAEKLYNEFYKGVHVEKAIKNVIEDLRKKVDGD